MARATLACDTVDLQEVIREIGRLYDLHCHRLSRHARKRIEGLAIGSVRTVEFGDVRDGVLPVYPSGELLAALADLRVVANVPA